jgi:hypothetical protein
MTLDLANPGAQGLSEEIVALTVVENHHRLGQC